MTDAAIEIIRKLRDLPVSQLRGDSGWYDVVTLTIEERDLIITTLRGSSHEGQIDRMTKVVMRAWKECGEVPFPLYEREAKEIAKAAIAAMYAPQPKGGMPFGGQSL